MIGCIGTPWVERKESSIHARLEDDTIAIRSMLALSCAIDTHTCLFDRLTEVSKHTGWLAKVLHDQLASLKHSNGRPVCRIYKALSSTYGDPSSQDPTVTFNVRKSDGGWKSGSDVGTLLRAKEIHVRTGSLCDPAGMASALGFSTKDLQAAFDSGFRCSQPGRDIRDDIPYGMIRATLGAMSTLQDVYTLMDFVEKHLTERSSRTLHVLGGFQTSKTEGNGLVSDSLDEKSWKENDRITASTTLGSTRPDRKQTVWRALFCYYTR